MITVALVGASGTGKSYRAIWLAGEKRLDYIIDDGILINHNKIIAGNSAKKAKTKVGAVKRAIFENDAERDAMKDAIRYAIPQGILVLGTSEKMVQRIRKRLDLPEYSEIIHIEDIATVEDIEKARLIRESQGKHVIPVPVMEIRKTFSGYFLDPFSVFRKTPASNDESEDKSIVRPSYSYMGDFVINDTVLCEIARYEASRVEGVHRAQKVSVEKTDGGVNFNVDLIMNYGVKLRECAVNTANAVKSAVERYASVYTDNVNINIRSLKTDSDDK